MTPTMAEIEAAIEAHIREEGEVPSGDPYFERDVDLFEYGYVDSVGFAELVTWLEDTYDIKLTEAYLFDERFTTIAGIASIVESRVHPQTR
jgi:methoxymalonate biosynthesis acyl carrier protein